MNRITGILIIMLLVIPLKHYGACQDSLFGTDRILELQLAFEFDTILDDIGEDPEYHDALLNYHDSEGNPVELEVELRIRGSFRKDTDNCNFPPLKLKIKKGEREGTIFEGIKSVKMVTHCQSYKRDYEQYVMQEYLMYRTFNLLSDMSFRVRLLKVTYIDSGESGRTLERFAFFMEGDEEMAERKSGIMLDIDIAVPDKVNQDQYSLVSFFEYMIINTDWSLSIMHNVVVVSTDYFEPPYPVPFDFDWSSIINIPYHVPGIGNKAEQELVRQFKGACRSKKEFKNIIDLFNDRRLEIYHLYLNFEYLEDEYKQQIFKQYNTFYNIINSRELFRENIRDHCDQYRP